VVNPAVAWQATQVLEKVVTSGTGTAANIGRPAAGKTGTAQQWRDAWFYGFIPQLSAAVWVGYPQGQISMIYPRTRLSRVFGGSYPAEIWHAFMAAVTPRMPVRDFQPPAGDFVTVDIDITQGCVATDATPSEFVREIQYVAGEEPTNLCDESDYVASGVPSVIGSSSSVAFQVLEDQGFTVEQSVEETDSASTGTVIEQYPDPGTELEPGSTVTIVVASSP
jgi:penicillin-binding protein 1A